MGGDRRDMPDALDLVYPSDPSLIWCRSCGGRGWDRNDTKPHVRERCRTCDGSGAVPADAQVVTFD